MCVAGINFIEGRGTKMLCPKCGFISFDHFSVCVKCHNDLSQIGSDLHGTATDSACRHFLRLVLREESALPESQTGIGEATSTIVFPPSSSDWKEPFEQDESVENAGQTEISPRGDFGEEDVAAAFPSNESPDLEFDLDEMPHLDISSFGTVGADEKTLVDEGIPDGTEAAPLDLGTDEVVDQGGDSLQAPIVIEDSPPDEKPEIGSESLEIDMSSLTLDSVQSSLNEGSVQSPLDEGAQSPLEDGGSLGEEIIQLSSQSSTEGESSRQLTIDLNEIDLSDLAHDQSGTSAARDDAGASSEEKGLDFEDTMDLSLFVGDGHDTAGDSTPFPSDTGLEPIDLTLMDEALIELAVDPGRKEPSFPKETPSGDVELSMEESHK